MNWYLGAGIREQQEVHISISGGAVLFHRRGCWESGGIKTLSVDPSRPFAPSVQGMLALMLLCDSHPMISHMCLPFALELVAQVAHKLHIGSPTTV